MQRLFAVVLVAAALPWAAQAAEQRITMAGGQYAPQQVNAKVGDALVFVNDDGADHNVFSPTVGLAVDIGRQRPGETKNLMLATPGTMEIECVFHPHMLLTVTVAR